MLTKLLKLDWILVICVFLLLGVSLIALYSISSSNQFSSVDIFMRQMMFAVIGISLMFFFVWFDYSYLKLYSGLIYFIALAVLLFLMFVGESIRGTAGWIDLGFVNIQPVEMAKIALIMILARFIAKKKYKFNITSRLIFSLIISGIMIFLVLKQPDFGSAMVLASIWAIMLLVSGLTWKHWTFLIISGLVFGCLVWVFLADYQKQRILSVVNPEVDPRGSGYNVIQSKVAIGSGGLIGKGIGHGSQSHLNFLPEKHTDFIFAVISEEAGFAGSSFVLILYLIIFFRLKKIAEETHDNFAYFFIIGVMAMFFFQIFINVGMNLGIAPVTGIPLPFLSYGGSSLVSILASIGIIQCIHIKNGEQFRLENY